MVQRLLECVTFSSQHRFVCIRWDVNWRRNIDTCSCKRLWNLESIPTRGRPIAFQSHRHRHDGLTGLFREQYGAHFCDVPRPLRTVDRKRCCATGAHQTRHLDDCADAAAGARAANGAVSKALNKPGDVLTVEAARSHDDDASFAPPVSRQKYAIVPKDVDWEPAVLLSFLVIFPPRYFETRREPNQVDQNVKDQIGGSNKETIFE